MIGYDTPVRLLVKQIDPEHPTAPSRRLLAVREPQCHARERLRAFARVRGLDRLVSEVDSVLDGDPPPHGYARLDSSNDAIRVIVLWPHYDGSLP
ncbi:hypothetical protein IM660_19290 [Ruania alkalisoli]|uniref:Uncharacterized protein n=1 Tax=Ruania alkalisoli TaxID=2779775 RepID=A0A7M1ST58_9MICO|nr:hypothetical protein [Ruania alkalisoli]QOR70685.1 hypothetical protein IM660_19290 [Ruania alkalisoli]